MPSLPDSEVKSRLTTVPDWQIESGELVRTFLFKDSRASLAFVNKVGDVAESAGHHPDIDIRYNKVRLALVTHDAGGITQKDFITELRRSSRIPARCFAGPWQSPHWDRKIGNTSRPKSILPSTEAWAGETAVIKAEQRMSEASPKRVKKASTCRYPVLQEPSPGK